MLKLKSSKQLNNIKLVSDFVGLGS